jgi:hypothetical protein
MATQTHDMEKSARHGWVGGAVLVVLGLFLLAQQFVTINLGWWVLPAVALVCLVAGVATRKAGLLIPGSLLAGLSLGVGGVLYPFQAAGEPTQGAYVLVTLAAGFAFITPLTALVTGRAHWWALVPAAVLALVGGAVFAGEAGLRALELAGKVWPLILVALGASLILRRK